MGYREKSDLTKDGSLDNREFAIAMCLIEHVLGGNTIPPVVPQQVINMNIPPPTVSAPVAGPTPAPGGPPPGQMQNSQSACESLDCCFEARRLNAYLNLNIINKYITRPNCVF